MERAGRGRKPADWGTGGLVICRRNRPALEAEEGAGGGRLAVYGVTGVDGTIMLGAVMLFPPHLIHRVGVGGPPDPPDDELLGSLPRPLRRGWYR